MDTARFEALLGELKLKFESEAIESEFVKYDIVLDESEGLEATAILYATEDGDNVRLMGYVDELDADSELDQLKMLLALNGELPTGSYCLDPDEGIIYATVNVMLSELTAEKLSWLVEFLLVAQEIYDEEMGPEGPDVVAQG